MDNRCMRKRAPELVYYARMGDLDSVKKEVDRGVPINGCDYMGRTGLYVAVVFGHRKVVQYLLRQGADMEASTHFQSTPLHAACDMGDDQMVECLIFEGSVDISRNDLCYAKMAIKRNKKIENMLKYVLNRKENIIN
jgi:uncharacterized protein